MGEIVVWVHYVHTLVRRYFGEKVALYFAWTGLYTEMLMLASIVGIIVMIAGFFTLSRSNNPPAWVSFTRLTTFILVFIFHVSASPWFCALSLPLERRSVTRPTVLSSTCVLSVMTPVTSGTIHKTVPTLQCHYSLTMEGLYSLRHSWLFGVSWHWTSVC